MKLKNPLVNYENKWVALDSKKNEVVESSSSLEVLYKKVNKSKLKNIVITKVLPFDMSFAPYVVL